MKETYKDGFNWWQVILKNILGMWRINNDSIDFKWGYFAPRYGFEFALNRGGYFNQRYSLDLCFIWGMFHIYLPFKTRIPENCAWLSYGIKIHDNTFWIYTGGKWKGEFQPQESWIAWYLPYFTWNYIENEKVVTPSESITFWERTSDKVYEITATVTTKERSWSRKWFPWITKSHICYGIRFSEEVGSGRNSWKGGTLGAYFSGEDGESALDPIDTLSQYLTKNNIDFTLDKLNV